MTLINFSERNIRNEFGAFSKMLFVAAFISAVAFVFQYNRTVSIRFDIRDKEAHIEKAMVENAEYKVKLNNMLSPESLDAAGQEFGLIKETRPEYYTESVEVAVRSR